METVAVVEVFDSHGRLKERHRVTSLPWRIGRGYDNHIILDDPMVSPRHIELRLGADQVIELLDLESTNGVSRIGEGGKQKTYRLTGNDEFKVGEGTLKVLSPTLPVASTILDRTSSRQALRVLHSGWFAAALLLVSIIYRAAIETYFENVEVVTTDRITTIALASGAKVAGALLVWAAIWSFVAKLNLHRSYFLTHFSVGAAVSLIGYLLDLMSEYLRFMTGYYATVTTIEVVAEIALIAVSLALHLRFSTMLSLRRRRIVAGAVTLLVGSLIGAFNIASQYRFANELVYEPKLKPPSFRLTAPVSVEKYKDQVKHLEEELNDALPR